MPMFESPVGLSVATTRQKDGRFDTSLAPSGAVKLPAGTTFATVMETVAEFVF
jgi:hypothetical protein